MTELIKITTDTIGQQVVSAKELHAFLEVKKGFTAWIKHRFSKYEFVEGQDYAIALPNRTANERGGHNAFDYALTLDIAKQIAMVEGNAKGKEARLYFIEAEKQLRSKHKPMSEIEILVHSALLLQQQERRLGIVEHRIDEIEAKQTTTLSDYYAIAGYASIKRVKVEFATAVHLGKKARAMCRESGYMVGAVPDPRYGTVNTYPKDVLETVFNDYFGLRRT